MKETLKRFWNWIYPEEKRRVKMTKVELDETIRTAVDNALLEATKWLNAEVDWANRKLVPAVPTGGPSIFESFPSTVSGGRILKEEERSKKGYSDLVEADWASVGLTPYQDPANEQTLEKLRLQQNASIMQWANYPIARSEIENFKRYVLGRGVKVGCHIPEVEKVLHLFWRRNKMETRNKYAFQTYLLQGEYFPVFYDNTDVEGFDKEKDPVLVLRTAPSTEISDIEYCSQDRETILCYKRETPKNPGVFDIRYYLDAFYPSGDEKELGLPLPVVAEKSSHETGEETQEQRMMVFKYGLQDDIRGRPFLESILKWNRIAVDFLYSRSRLNHLRSKIYLIEVRLGKSGKTMTSSGSVETMPQGGVKLIETPDRQFKILSPNTGADDAEKDYKMLLYMIGSALSMPLHILNSNAENENLASIREAANPFNQAVTDFQDEWGEHLKRMLSYVVVHAVRKGILEKQYEIEYLPEDLVGEIKGFINSELKAGVDYNTVLEQAKEMAAVAKKKKTIQTVDAPIEVTFPQLIKSDPTQEAQAVKIYMELGLMSLYTGRLKIGVDPDVEQARIDSEWEAKLEKQETEITRFDKGMPGSNKNAPPKANPEEEPEEPEGGEAPEKKKKAE